MHQILSLRHAAAIAAFQQAAASPQDRAKAQAAVSAFQLLDTAELAHTPAEMVAAVDALRQMLDAPEEK